MLHHFEPPTTEEEIRAASLQYVRKVSGVNKPSQADAAAFEAAVEAIAKTTSALLASLSSRGPVRTREGEREKGKARWALRASRISRG